jgi:ubiquinone/menaquinone biosynthesis C-methylase UbiE
MESEVLSLLCDPDTRYEFELEGSTLRNTATGRVYPIRDDIPLFVSTLTGLNLKHQSLYDRIAPGYDLAETLSRLIKRKPNFRREIIAELEIEPEARVLEVGAGTGANLRLLPENIDFYGIDLSWGMLRKFRKNLRKWNRSAHLFQGEAARLPFRADVFDCVFHMVGIRFFSDPGRAIREMIWVAKPGTRIVIADEIEKVVQQNEQKKALVSEAVRSPIDLVPKEMQEIESREIADGKLYCLTFRKPAAAIR